jgi:hypothetical protein
MIKSTFYIIFSIIFLTTSVLIIGYIIRQEAEKNNEQKTQGIISTETNHGKEESLKNDAGDRKITSQEKDEADNLLVDIDKLIVSIEEIELAE